jgi:hypothetical protein
MSFRALPQAELTAAPSYPRRMAVRRRRFALAMLLSGIAVLTLPGIAHAAATATYATITANAPTTPGSCGAGTTGCVTSSASVLTAKTGTLPASISVTYTLCKGTSTASCTAVYTWPAIVVYPSPYKNNTTYAVSASVKCKTIGTTSYFVRAVMSNTSSSVTAYSTPKSQSGCLTA